tara:strand:- start:1857 stop:2096 length:240 start_codon:yes stop_codon:yes gene_type:complete
VFKLYSDEAKRSKLLASKTRRFAEILRTRYDAIYKQEKEQSEADGLNYTEEELQKNTSLQIQPMIEEQTRILSEYVSGK